MKLKVLGSSSTGNCYFLESKDEVLIIECGINTKDIKKALDWSFKKVVGCLVSHSHNDHSKSMKDMLASGVKTYALKDTFDAKNISSPFSREVIEGQDIKIGKFNIKVLPAKHDVPIVSFLIHHEEIGSLLFATDTYLIPYQVIGVNHWMIEANYDKAKLSDDVLEGNVNPYLARRIVKSHMSIEKTLEAVKGSGISHAKNIILIHLSDSNSDLESFKTRMQELTGCPVWVADKGLEISL